MKDLDKEAMGKRIRQIRLSAGLRQWELAGLLGTTQSAIHKYEHGVVPEPRRLVELARIGDTSIEWVLTGHHWENGAETRVRLSPDILNTAYMLREISEEGRATVDEALRIIREAVKACKADEGGQMSPDAAALTASIRDHSDDTLRVLESAYRIQRAVLSRVARETEKRLEDPTVTAVSGAPGATSSSSAEDEGDAPPAGHSSTMS